MSTKQLYEKTSEGMKEVSPLVAIEDIYSKLSDTPLEALVSLYNHVKCEWKGSVADTRRTVPLFLRRSGLFITYNNGTKYVTEFFSAGTDQITTEGWVKDSNWTPVPDEDYISAGVKPGVGSIGYEQLNDNLKQLFREKVNVTNFPDDEDITSVDNMLKFKDREVNAANFQSKGYVILRKNLRLVNGIVKNILTQDMINKPNIIYEIRYDFDLDGETIEIPASSEIIFKGGNITNGTLALKGNIYAKKELTLKNIKLKGCLYINTDELVHIQNCSFYSENDFFDKFSASIYVNYNNANVVIENCTFLSNRTVSNAIVVNYDINSLVIISCDISCYLRAALYSIYNIYNCKVQLNYIHNIGNLLDKDQDLYVGAYGIRIGNTSNDDTYPNCNIDILSNKFKRIYTYRNLNNDKSECHAILLYANNVNISNNYIKDILAGESEEDINIFGGQAHEAIYVKGENPVITYNRIINGTGHCNSDGSICHKHKNTTSNISYNIIEQKFGDGIYCLADDVNISYNTITIVNNYSDSDASHIARLTAIRNISVDDRDMCKGIISNNKIVLKSRITNNMSFAIYCNSRGRFVDIFNNYICSEDKCINPFRIDCYKLDNKNEDSVIRICDNTYIGYHTYIFSIYNINDSSGYKFIFKSNNIKLLDLNSLPIIYNIDVPDSSFQIIGNEFIGFYNSYLLVFIYSSVSIKNLLVDGNYMDLYIKYFVESNFSETSQILFKNNILATLEFLLHSDKVNDLFFINNFIKNEEPILLRNLKSEFTNIELDKFVAKSNFPNFSIKTEGTYTCKESFCDIWKMKGKIKNYNGAVFNNKKIITRVDNRDFDAFGVSEYMKRKASLQKIKEAQSNESLPIGYLAVNTDTNMPIIYIGNNEWLSVNGFNPEYSQKGNSDSKPQLSKDEEGFEFYDTTHKKKILWNGTSWVNLDGTVLT